MKMTIPMMTNLRIQTLWQVLKSNKTPGFIKQLYDSDMYANLYATYRYPNDVYGIAISFSKELRVDISTFASMKELSISLIEDSSMQNHNMLSIQLNDSNNMFVFAVLCEDLISSILGITDQMQLLKAILNQLERWRNLFDSARSKTLSESEQLGLFGELSFLSSLLNSVPNKRYEMLHTWMGVEKASKDFQGKEWAVEVKATLGKKDIVAINGETQLDNEIFKYLFLCHYTIERNNTYGTTLPELIDTMMSSLQDDQISLAYFKMRLAIAGYHPDDRSNYEYRHYTIKKRDVYNVTKDFPRIVKEDLKKGVCNVTYSVLLDTCDSFLITESKLLQIINQL
jgi:hypothetical protein